MKMKLNLKSFYELPAASVGTGDNHRPVNSAPPSAFSADERARLPLNHSSALLKATTVRRLPVGPKVKFSLSAANG